MPAQPVNSHVHTRLETDLEYFTLSSALKSLAALEEHRGTTIKPAAAQNKGSAIDGS